MCKKILIVDDENEILELMEGWLTHLKYDVITAANGDDALWKIKREKPDLIILDMLIPGLTGNQLLEKLKTQSEKIRQIPVIMMSARESMGDLSKEVFAFVLKPFDAKEMLGHIQTALQERKNEIS